jgi:hypothetical protein
MMCRVDDPRQRFLELLSGGASSGGAETAPAPSAPDRPAAEAVDGPPAGEPPAPGAPLTFEQTPPAVEEVPAAMTALAAAPDTPPPPPDPSAAGAGGPPLMDLGHDAQLQGTELALHSIGIRLAVISEGLKLIPILAGVARDLEHLNYPDVAKAVDALLEWARSEEKALNGERSDRAAARQGSAPAQ